MKTERLIVLVSPEEKARVERLAKRQRKSVAELVRNALSDFEAAQVSGGGMPGALPNGEAPAPLHPPVGRATTSAPPARRSPRRPSPPAGAPSFAPPSNRTPPSPATTYR